MEFLGAFTLKNVTVTFRDEFNAKEPMQIVRLTLEATGMDMEQAKRLARYKFTGQVLHVSIKSPQEELPLVTVGQTQMR